MAEKTPKQIEEERKKSLPDPRKVIIIQVSDFLDILDRLSNLLRYFGKKEKESKKKLQYHSFFDYEVKMRAFYLQLENFVAAQSAFLQTKQSDINGRIIIKPDTTYAGTLSAYKKLIITFSNEEHRHIVSIGLLNPLLASLAPNYELVKKVIVPPGENPIIPFYNTFDPTITSILSVHEELNERIKDKRKEASFFKCGQENVANTVSNRLGNVAGLGMNYFSVYDPPVETDILWTDFAKKYFFPVAGVESRGIKIIEKQITIDDLKKISKKNDQNSVKTEEQLRQENEDFASANFNAAIFAKRQQQSDNNQYSPLIDTPQQMGINESKINRIQSRGVAALEKCRTRITSRYNVACLIKEAAECLIPPISCREIVRGFRLSQLETIFPKILPPATAKALNEKVDKWKRENSKNADSVDGILDEIEKFVDLEIICDIIKLLANLQFPPKFNFDLFPLININRNISIQINDAILEAIVSAICGFLDATLDQLTNCNYLDKFIAGAIENPNGPFASQVGDLMLRDFNRNLDEYSGQLAKQICNNIRVNNTTDIDFFGLNLSEFNQTGQLGQSTTRLSLNPGKVIGSVIDVSKNNEQQQVFDNIGEYRLEPDGTIYRQSKNGRKIIIPKNTETPVPDIFSDYVSGESEEEIAAKRKQVALRQSGLDDCEKIRDTIKTIIKEVTQQSTPGEVLKWMSGETPENIRIKLEELTLSLPLISTEQISSETTKEYSYKTPNIRYEVITETFFKETGIEDVAKNLIGASQTTEGRRAIRNIPLRLPGFCEVPDIAAPVSSSVSGAIQQPPSGTYKYPQYVTDLIDSTQKVTQKINEIKCNINSGLTPDGKKDPIIEKSLNQIIRTIYDPIKSSFDQEIQQYVDAISRETTGTIDHKEKYDDGNINPQFLNLKSNGQEPKDGVIKETVKIVDQAYLLKNNLSGNFNISYEMYYNSPQNVGAIGNSIRSPSYVFEIKSKFPFGAKEFINSQMTLLSSSEKNYLDSIKNEEIKKQLKLANSLASNSNYAAALPKTPETTVVIREKESTERFITKYFNEFYVSSSGAVMGNASIIKRNFMYDTSYDIPLNSLQSNRIREENRQKILTKKEDIKNKILNNNSGSNNIFEITNKESNEIKLNTIQLSPIGLVDGCDKSLLRIRDIKNLTKNMFYELAKEECEKEPQNLNGDKPSESPVSKAATYTMILLSTKIYCIQFILKTLNICMQTGFNKNIIFSEEVKDFIVFEMIDDLKRLGLYEQVFSKNLIGAHKTIIGKNLNDKELEQKYRTLEGKDADTPQRRILKNLIEFASEDILKQFFDNIGMPRETNKKISQYVTEPLTRQQYQNYEDKIYSSLLINASLLTSSAKMINLFEGTKRILRDAMINVTNSGNYGAENSFEQDGGYLALSDQSKAKAGGPTDDPNILFWLIRAPLYIYRGFTEVIDPNIGISATISKIAESGLLLPDITAKPKQGEECKEYKTSEEIEEDKKSKNKKFPEDFNIRYPGKPLKIPYLLTGLPLLWAGIPVTPFGIACWGVDLALMTLVPSGKKPLTEKKDCSDLTSEEDISQTGTQTDATISSTEETGKNCDIE